MHKKGYGVFGRPHRLAHRLSFERVYGPIPDGLTVDHECEVKACVEPEHLRLLTAKENSRAWQRMPLDGSTCKRGHRAWYPGSRSGRFCLTCASDGRKRRMLSARDSGQATNP